MENEFQSTYDELFDESAKAQAFDKIAKNYYFCNFGTMQKNDLDILLFSIFIDRILDKKEADINSYSDYTLSKMLGITQTRISNLKVKKELRYHYKNFDWKKSFLRILENARLENEKIKMYIPDTNLYLEIKNAIEVKGDYVDVVLNPKLLQVSPASFLDLVVEVADGDDEKKKIRDIVKSKLDSNQDSIEFLTHESFSKQLKQGGAKIALELFAEILRSLVPVVGKQLGDALERFSPIIENFIKKTTVSQKRDKATVV